MSSFDDQILHKTLLTLTLKLHFKTKEGCQLLLLCNLYSSEINKTFILHFNNIISKNIVNNR